MLQWFKTVHCLCVNARFVMYLDSSPFGCLCVLRVDSNTECRWFLIAVVWLSVKSHDSRVVMPEYKQVVSREVSVSMETEVIVANTGFKQLHGCFDVFWVWKSSPFPDRDCSLLDAINTLPKARWKAHQGYCSVFISWFWILWGLLLWSFCLHFVFAVRVALVRLTTPRVSRNKRWGQPERLKDRWQASTWWLGKPVATGTCVRVKNVWNLKNVSDLKPAQVLGPGSMYILCGIDGRRFSYYVLTSVVIGKSLCILFIID